MSSAEASPAPTAFRRALLSWYRRRGRHELPWRGAFHPYRVLVSEFMLQQTTVSAVIPYFHRFLKAFPTLRALARADDERVLELWSGLGYYARARNLKAAAARIAGEFQGLLPENRADCESLPGVGPYTAGALLSFAHDKPEALVDGNVVRVLCRIYGIEGDVKDPRTKETLWALARTLVPPGGGRHFNSALMDFGATVCRPSGPACGGCPFEGTCRARRWGRQEELPLASAVKAKKELTLHVGLIRRGETWALLRRPAKGLYGGLWEFPSAELAPGAGAEEVAGALSERIGAPVALDHRLAPLTHVLTHRLMRLRPWLATGTAAGRVAAWRSPREIGAMAVSSITRKLLALVPGGGNARMPA